MIFVVLAFGFAIISYTALIRYIFVGWSSIKEEVSPDSYEDLPSVTVIIAARNEAGCIKKCVDSILANDFPKYKFEIIVVDDQSTDNTAEIASSIDKEVVRVVTTAGRSGGKKAALEYGIGMAVYPVIITTDADSLVGNKWLGVHSKMHANEDIKMTTGLVLPEVDDTVLSRFQWMDFAATMAITANGIQRCQYYLANGANISYTKQHFIALSGYEGDRHLASGDDLFFMNKTVQADPKSIRFVMSRDALVTTKAESDWRSFVHQRKRWATKSLAVKDKGVMRIQGFVFGYCLMVLLGIVVGWLISPVVFWMAVVSLFIKMLVDFLFLSQLAAHFDNKKVMHSFFVCFFIYFGHILLSGWHALFPTPYVWKERHSS